MGAKSWHHHHGAGEIINGVSYLAASAAIFSISVNGAIQCSANGINDQLYQRNERRNVESGINGNNQYHHQ